MRYAESIDYLNSFLNLERITYLPDNRRWNLDRMFTLLRWFDHPEKSFFPLLIAGTKGKGSTGFFLESILKEARVPAGFYSSPHLEDPRERIRIGGRIVSKSKWAAGLRTIHSVLNSYVGAGSPRPQQGAETAPLHRIGQFTYFEIMTLLAMILFEDAGVRIGIFEVGMGGRLDATNVLNARLAVLTPIHLDHEAFLGNTIAQITREKAAIIRPKSWVVMSPQRQAALREIKRKAARSKAHVVAARPVKTYAVGLSGDFQKTNAGAALQAARLLQKEFGFPVSEGAIRRGLLAHDWPGRFETFKGRPSFLLDAAHNPASTQALVKNLKRLYPKKRSILIFGVSREKKFQKMLAALSDFFSRIILTPIPTPRSQEISLLLKEARRSFRQIFPVGSVKEALRLANKIVSGDSLVVLTGSFYLLGEARSLLRHA